MRTPSDREAHHPEELHNNNKYKAGYDDGRSGPDPFKPFVDGIAEPDPIYDAGYRAGANDRWQYGSRNSASGSSGSPPSGGGVGGAKESTSSGGYSAGSTGSLGAEIPWLWIGVIAIVGLVVVVSITQRSGPSRYVFPAFVLEPLPSWIGGRWFYDFRPGRTCENPIDIRRVDDHTFELRERTVEPFFVRLFDGYHFEADSQERFSGTMTEDAIRFQNENYRWYEVYRCAHDESFRWVPVYGPGYTSP